MEMVTKRLVARQIASVYDPLGWIVPLPTQAKSFQRNLWKQQFQWDTEIPPELRNQWSDIIGLINGFQKSFPRRVCASFGTQNLAVFADAREIAIAACAYPFNEKTSALVMAKGKLPSVKTITTMPKLELNALTLATLLANSISEVLKTHSHIVLNWLSAPRRSHLGVLVEKRGREIRRIVENLEEKRVTVLFSYVNTNENPADAGTRGLAKEGLSDYFWWTGPKFLKTPIGTWSTKFNQLAHVNDTTFDDVSNGECLNISVASTAFTESASVHELLNWTRYSSFPEKQLQH
ncbi:Pao retrotransposon peptidase [Ancylostoma duodenale]|uniref:Pao retrotransposon peptidase n=1 Tax=Ancylostoma duodenale TaxID=51022 RepID=A0A0C2GHQ2_9BILA|nr:Pao retrotransposon peptidase [Ancylostoma duodenale]